MQQLRDVNEALLLSAICQHELVEKLEKAEAALRASEARLRYAANVAGLTYVEVELESGRARKAENFGAVMGYAIPNEPESDVFEDTALLLEHVVPEDRVRVNHALEDFLVGKPVGKIEYRVLGDDGIVRGIESRWSLERDGNGKPLKTFAINLDVTERRQAEDKFRGLLESAPDAMVIIDETGTIVLVNSQTEKVFGFPRQELLGQPVEMLIPHRFRQHHQGHRTGYFSRPRIRPMGGGLELFGMRKNGTEFPIEISLSPLQTEEGVQGRVEELVGLGQLLFRPLADGDVADHAGYQYALLGLQWA